MLGGLGPYSVAKTHRQVVLARMNPFSSDLTRVGLPNSSRSSCCRSTRDWQFAEFLELGLRGLGFRIRMKTRDSTGAQAFRGLKRMAFARVTLKFHWAIERQLHAIRFLASRAHIPVCGCHCIITSHLEQPPGPRLVHEACSHLAGTPLRTPCRDGTSLMVHEHEHSHRPRAMKDLQGLHELCLSFFGGPKPSPSRLEFCAPHRL
jgi:hypothetical protein